MPFITEEIWQMIGERKDGESLMISRMPESKKFNRELVAGFEPIKETISCHTVSKKGETDPDKETH